MQAKFILIISLLVVLFAHTLSGAEAITVKKDVTTVNEIQYPRVASVDKISLKICWSGKLCWNNGHWERQIVLFNDNDEPQLNHPVHDYVKNLPAPNFEGKRLYESLYEQEFRCGAIQDRFNYEKKFEKMRSKPEFKISEGTTKSSGNRQHDKELSLTTALRNMVEQFGVKLKSKTEVVDSQLASDIIKTEANRSVQFVPVVEQYHIKDGQKEFQVIVWGWLDE